MKPGIKTSEFWVTVIISILGVLVALGVITPEQKDTLAQSIQQIAGAVMAAAPVIGYALSRGRAKQSDK